MFQCAKKQTQFCISRTAPFRKIIVCGRTKKCNQQSNWTQAQRYTCLQICLWDFLPFHKKKILFENCQGAPQSDFLQITSKFSDNSPKNQWKSPPVFKREPERPRERMSDERQTVLFKNSSMELAVIWGNSDFAHTDFHHSDSAHSDFPYSDFAHSDFAHFVLSKNLTFSLNIHNLGTYLEHMQMETNLTKWNFYTLFQNNIHI